jgi:hypothetical protein
MSKQRWNQAEVKNWMEQLHESGLDKTSFCKMHGITYSRFLYWNKRLNQTEAKPDVNGGFVSLKVEQASTSENICLKGANGLVLYVATSPASLQFVKALLSC